MPTSTSIRVARVGSKSDPPCLFYTRTFPSRNCSPSLTLRITLAVLNIFHPSDEVRVTHTLRPVNYSQALFGLLRDGKADTAEAIMGMTSKRYQMVKFSPAVFYSPLIVVYWSRPNAAVVLDMRILFPPILRLMGTSLLLIYLWYRLLLAFLQRYRPIWSQVIQKGGLFGLLIGLSTNLYSELFISELTTAFNEPIVKADGDVARKLADGDYRALYVASPNRKGGLSKYMKLPPLEASDRDEAFALFLANRESKPPLVLLPRPRDFARFREQYCGFEYYEDRSFLIDVDYLPYSRGFQILKIRSRSHGSSWQEKCATVDPPEFELRPEQLFVVFMGLLLGLAGGALAVLGEAILHCLLVYTEELDIVKMLSMALIQHYL